MDLMEYKARDLFEAAGIPVPKAVTVASTEELEACMGGIAFPAVAKAQVQSGKRGKAGGILRAGNAEELRAATEKLLAMSINGLAVKRVMVVPQVSIAKEYYLSVLLDRNSKSHKIIFSACGGMDIEETAKSQPDKVITLDIKPGLGLLKPSVRYLAEKAGVDPAHWAGLEAVAMALYRCCNNNDCVLAEINPLVVDTQGNLIALDAKVTVDDSALYRLADLMAYRDTVEENPLVLEARQFKFLYIPCGTEGEVVVMSNGSGLLMSCIDLLAKQGVKTLAVLDLGGGATRERVKEAIRILTATQGTKIIFINIFGGIKIGRAHV
jgi:succinyl-CoA synthetase beta subunit